MSTTDIEHLKQWKKSRDAHAFQWIIDEYAGMVFGTSRRITGSNEDAEDVAQECFLKLAQEPPTIHSSLGSWLHRVATNTSLNSLKKTNRRLAREDRYDKETLKDETSEIIWDDIQHDIDEAINALPEKYKDAVVEHFLNGMTQSQAAHRIGVSRQTITYRVEKGIDQIRKSLQEKGYTVGAATLVTMLEAIVAEAVPASLSASLSKLALSGVSVAGSSWWAWLNSFGAKAGMGLAGLLLALAWALGIFGTDIRPDDQTTSIDVAEEKPVIEEILRQPLETETNEPETQAAPVDRNASISNHAQASKSEKEDSETSLISGLVVAARNRLPISGTTIMIYPEEAVEFKIEPERGIPNVSRFGKDELKIIQDQMEARGEGDFVPWSVYSTTLKLNLTGTTVFQFETDENGRFEADELKPGAYVAVVASEKFTNSDSLAHHLENVGEVQISSASVIHVLGSDQPQEFTIECGRNGTVKGRIYDAFTNTPIPNQTVTAYRWTDSSYVRTKEAQFKTNDEGVFAFDGLQPGDYEIVRQKVDGLHGEPVRTLTIKDGAQHDGFDFPVSTGASVQGTVYWGEEPLADTEFDLHFAHVDKEISKSTGFSGKLLKNAIRTDQNGRYFASGIRDLNGIVYGAVRLTNNNVRKTKWVRGLNIFDGDSQTIDLKFDIGTSVLQGRFTMAGKPVHKALINWYGNDLVDGIINSQTDEDGRFYLEGLSAGRSSVSIYLPRKFECVTRTVYLEEGGISELNVDIPEKTIRINVNNIPENMKSAYVSITRADAPESNGEVFSEWVRYWKVEWVARSRVYRYGGSNSRCDIWGLEPGNYRIEAISLPVDGYVGVYGTDPKNTENYLKNSVVLVKDFVVDETTKTTTIDFNDGEPMINMFPNG